MNNSEIEEVLSNWIRQAIEPPGKLEEEIDPAQWIATKFLNWWKSNVEESLDDADEALKRVRKELQRLGCLEKEEFDELIHELTHATDALSDVRSSMTIK